MLGILTVRQTSQDGVTKTIDRHGEKLDMGNSLRYSYMEKSGAHVLLDISDTVVSLRRRDAGLTQAIFDRNNKSEMIVHNEHGKLSFDVQVHLLEIKENTVSIHYDLIHLDEVIGQHEFQLDWKVGS